MRPERHSDGPSIPPNAAPIVTLTFDGPATCAPLPAQPCIVAVLAAAQDPEGDSLSYAWSGCATGTSSRATCTIRQPGEALATIAVRDDRGNSVRRSVVVLGTNQPPAVTLTGIVWESSGAFELYGAIRDPEEGELCGGGELTGPCRYVQSATGIRRLQSQRQRSMFVPGWSGRHR